MKSQVDLDLEMLDIKYWIRSKRGTREEYSQLRRREEERERNRKVDVVVKVSPALVLTKQEQALLDKMLVNPVILGTVFSFLPPSDVMSVALVCSAWRAVVECPRFWSWAKMRLSEVNFAERFNSERAAVVKSWKVNGLPSEQLNLLFSGLKYIKLRKLDLGRTDLSSICGEVLSEAVVRLSEVDLSSTCLTDLQLETVVRRITQGEDLEARRLRRLDISKLCLSSLPACLLSQLVLRLEEVSLLRTELSQSQLSGVLEAILDSRCPLLLSKLNLTRNDLSSVPADLLAGALVRLQEATLFQTELGTRQVESLCQAVVSSQSPNLRSLRLSYNNLFSVSASLLSQAVVRLEEVNLRTTNLQSEQILQVCRAIVDTDQLRLRKLNISHNGSLGLEADTYCSQAKEKLRALEVHHMSV